MIHCRCESPIMDVEHDAGCRRCGDPVDFSGHPPVDARVRLRHDVDRYPHFLARAGATGTVTTDDDVFTVRMDEHIDGAEEWDNEIVWSPRDGDRPNDDVEMIDVEGATS
jgi:hypothetical protein